MKAKIIPIIILFCIAAFFFSSCEDTSLREYKGYAPVYLSLDDLRSSVISEQGSDLKNPGKIYYKDNYIFIVEELKGIHVYDNTNPASPVNKSFVKLPGVVDISISGNILYADSYVDLVVIDLQDIDNIKEVGRVKNVLPYTVPTVPDDFPMGYVDQEKGVVVDWELRIIKEKVNTNPTPYPIYWNKGGIYYLDAANSQGASSGVSGSGVGIGGSMARFGIRGNVLYIVDSNVLKVFDITNKTAPGKVNDIYAGWNIETLFLTETNMFLGSTTGMAVYDITNSSSPVWKCSFTHARSCDPVIVDDTIAYITLRTGTGCGGNLNVLDVVGIGNITKPVALRSYSFTNPHGLGKAGDILFICDGSAGLKVYDASNPLEIASHQIYSYPGINAFDVIPVGNLLVLIGDDGLYQYNYSDLKNIKLLSSIQIVK